MNETESITLASGSLALELAPAVGGAIARFWAETDGRSVELLRPAPPRALAERVPWAMGNFPLVPWSNRIREGRFSFGGHAIQLAANHPPEPHAIHGLGFQRPWTVTDRTGATAVLEHRHTPDAWPWAFRAVQRFALTAGGLDLELSLTNESDALMPAGLGWHPYFPRTPQATLTARVTDLWLTDAESLPVDRVPPPRDRDPGQGLAVDRVPLDNAFAGWDGRALIAWPEHGARLRLAAPPPLQILIVYTPPDRPFFCAEPVSHLTDAFNLAGGGLPDTGMLVLEPGETLRAALTLTPEIG